MNGFRAKNVLTGLIICLNLIPFFPLSTHGFYERELADGFLEIRGMFRVFSSYNKNPRDIFIPMDRTKSGFGGLARLIVQGNPSNDLGFEVHAYQTYIPSQLLSNPSEQLLSLDVERSSSLDHSFSGKDHIHMGLDRLNIKWSCESIDLTIGRQPINLATTFYFTPNDFFAPFAAQSFFRLYKPGVDAARVDVELGYLSQLSFINVLGYQPEPLDSNGWSHSPDNNRMSSMGKISTVYENFEYALLVGEVRHMHIIGGSIQGELFKWLGVRLEGHYANPDSTLYGSWSEICTGVEHRWENSLDLRLEYFYHGGGSGTVARYRASSAVVMGESVYLGKKYTALGASYELNPLLNLGISTIANLIDDSYLISLNTLYSLSDEAELSISLGIPLGDEPESMTIRSEFGSYPKSLNIELRYYF